jgi:putative flippase GtrA
MSERSRLTRFLLAGSAGFTVDALLLSALVNGYAWSPYRARALSFSLAFAITWYLNRRLTFRDRPSQRLAPELLRYALVQFGGVIANYGVFSAVVALSEQAARWPFIALVPAAATAMGFTYFGMLYYAFPRQPLAGAHD